jgi:heptosyltransferase-2
MNVMIRVPNWVGDAVMAEPALRELRRIFLEAQITLLARPWVAGLFDGENLHDAFIPVNDASGFTQTTARFWQQAQALRREQFGYAILLQNAFVAALTARAAGVRNVVGYPTDGRRPLLHTAINFEPDYRKQHQVFYYLNIAAELERRLTGDTRVNLSQAQPRLHATEPSREQARKLLAENGWQSKPLVAINPGATNSRAKQWLAERFAATADRLFEQHGLQAVIVGAAGDGQAAEAVKQVMRSSAIQLAGKTSIAELKAVLSLCQLAISNDTGTAHVAAALQVPTVTIFGPTEDFATRPFAETATVVRHPVECSPCMLKDCPIDHRCMTRIAVADVYKVAETLLDKTTIATFDV